MWKKNLQICLEMVIASFFIVVCLIEFFRPISNFPIVRNQTLWNQILVENNDNIWAKFGFFGGQFAYFTNWTNWLFVGTIFYGYILQRKVNCYWKNSLSVYLFITTVIFFMIISPFLNWGDSIWIDYIAFHEHLLTTIFWIIFLFMTKSEKIKSWTKSVIITLSVPIIYFLFTLIIYLIYDNKVAIYPFLDYLNILNLQLEQWISVIISCFLLMFIIIGIITANFLFFELNDYQSTHKKRLNYFKQKNPKKRPLKDFD